MSGIESLREKSFKSVQILQIFLTALPPPPRKEAFFALPSLFSIYSLIFSSFIKYYSTNVVSLSPKQLTLVENQKEYCNYESTAVFQTRIPRFPERVG